MSCLRGRQTTDCVPGELVLSPVIMAQPASIFGILLISLANSSLLGVNKRLSSEKVNGEECARIFQIKRIVKAVP